MVVHPLAAPRNEGVCENLSAAAGFGGGGVGDG